ncbi:hypothetical protein [Winogradskyella sp. A3E31]
MKKRLPLENKLESLDVSPKGSLGILAFGDLGLRAWRESRKENQTKKK